VAWRCCWEAAQGPHLAGQGELYQLEPSPEHLRRRLPVLCTRRAGGSGAHLSRREGGRPPQGTALLARHNAERGVGGGSPGGGIRRSRSWRPALT
jgi:hypothetical protein